MLEDGDPYTYESNRDDLLAFLRAAGKPVHLVGHSYGAGVVLLAALREPWMARSLILIEPALGSLLPRTAPGLDAELASRTALAGDMQSLLQSGQNQRAAEVLIDWTQGGPGGFAKLPISIREVLRSNAKTLGPTFAGPAPNVTCDDLRRLRVPTLVLTGDRTRLFYRLVAEATASCVPGAVIEQISDAGHMSIVEQPDRWVDTLMAFLGEH
jgi:pimeloyl-ACP methyl ester carboxylesterase